MVRSAAVSSAPPWPTPRTARSLRDRWHRRCADGGVPIDVATRGWAALVTQYGSAARGYHTLEHIGEVLAWIDRLAPEPAPALELAAWLHDVVYVAGATDNEQASARWTRELFAGHLRPEQLARACSLILMTAGHEPDPDDLEACMLADADLAILGAPPERYRRYVTDVRAEYASLDDHAWTAGRRRVLQSMLDRSHLYHHPDLESLEARARQNLASEVADLDRTGSGPSQAGRA